MAGPDPQEAPLSPSGMGVPLVETAPRRRQASVRLLSEPQVSRLSLYRRQLQALPLDSPPTIHSHTLAALCGTSAAHVRRDLMTIGFAGSPVRGYDVEQLIGAIGRQLDAPEGQRAVLVGVGQLGRALLNYFTTRRPHLRLVAAFDIDPEKTGRVIHGCRVWPLAELGEVVREQGITVGVLTVPVEAAQEVADRMVEAGIAGFLNFAPVPLRLPARTFVEEMDITTSMERAAYFARALVGGGRRKDEQRAG